MHSVSYGFYVKVDLTLHSTLFFPPSSPLLSPPFRSIVQCCGNNHSSIDISICVPTGSFGVPLPGDSDLWLLESYIFCWIIHD